MNILSLHNTIDFFSILDDFRISNKWTNMSDVGHEQIAGNKVEGRIISVFLFKFRDIKLKVVEFFIILIDELKL